MICLILTFALFVAAAAAIESLLLLNTLFERVVMVFSIAAGLLILSGQILSLGTMLNSRGLVWASIVIAGLGFCVRLILPPPGNRIPWKKLLDAAQVELGGEKDGRFVLFLMVAALGYMGLNAVAGAFMLPLGGDAYHYEMPLFWVQNQSIKPFVTHDPRIICASFAGEMLGFPGYSFCKSGAASLAIVWIGGSLSLWLVFLLARRLGCSPRASAVAMILPLGVGSWQQCFIQADAHMCLAGLWCAAGLLFLMRCRGAVELSQEVLTRLGCAVFCCTLGCSAKNSTIFLAPFFLLATAAILRRLLFKRSVFLVVSGVGVAALLCSGMLWNYAWNFKFCGNISGPPSLQETLAKDHSIGAVWTRCCRGATLFVLDTGWLPRPAQKTYTALCQKTVRLLGGSDVLTDDLEYLYHFRDLRPGSGLGLIGPVFILPAFIYGAILFCRQKLNSNAPTDPTNRADYILLLLAVMIFAFTCHALLRWQNMGLWRLMPAFTMLAAPVTGLLFERRSLRVVAIALVIMSLLVSVVGNLSQISNRFARGNVPLQQFFAKLGKQPREEVACQWGNEAAEKMILYEPYYCLEIPLLFLQRAKHPAVIAFAGGFTSSAYYFFGPDFSNRIMPLVDCRNPEQLLAQPTNADYLVYLPEIAIDTEKLNLLTAQQGYHPFLRVNREGRCIFLSFEKNSNYSVEILN